MSFLSEKLLLRMAAFEAHLKKKIWQVPVEVSWDLNAETGSLRAALTTPGFKFLYATSVPTVSYFKNFNQEADRVAEAFMVGLQQKVGPLRGTACN